MGIRIIVPELLREARGKRTMDVIVAAADNKFTKAIYSKWESGAQPKAANIEILCEALGVKYEKISLPIEKVPETSKFFAKEVK